MDIVLTSRERSYVASLKKRHRQQITDVIHRHKHRRGACEAVPFRVQVLQSRLPEGLRCEIFDRLDRCDSDKFVLWVQKAMRLPLGVVYCTPPKSLSVSLQDALQVMNATVTGQDSAKREVLRLICASSRGTGDGGGYALGFEGPPGVGKTHFVKHALAPALGRPFVSIPLGGANDVSYLLGSNYTYEGSKEGRLAAALVEAGCCNPIIHFDEVDKVGRDRGGDIESVLIHITDPTAPHMRDRYFHDIDLDFSKCTFVFGFNDAERVSPILLDRMKRVRFEAPTIEQRREIVTTHLLPRVNERYGTDVRLSTKATDVVMTGTEGSGMRDAERRIDHLVSLVLLCDTLGGKQVGAIRCAAFDENGDVSYEFARAALPAAVPQPVVGSMYT